MKPDTGFVPCPPRWSRRDSRAAGVQIITFGGIAGETHWDAFRGWATRVRRHVGWRLIRPELDIYIEHSRVNADNDWFDATYRATARSTWHTLTQLRDWVQGPVGWEHWPRRRHGL